MKRNVNDIFLMAMLSICSLVQIDASILDVEIKTILLLVCVMVFLVAKLITDKKFIEIQTDHIDIAVYGAGVLALIGMVSKLIAQPEAYGKYMTLMSLCMLYFVVRNYLQDIRAELIFFGSVFNAVISVLLLYHYMIDIEFAVPIWTLLQEGGGILPWLIMMITINVLGFCTYDRKLIWYGVNVVIGFFLLFLQNNTIATIIVGAVLFQIALRYMTRKKTVKRVMQMAFAYLFLLCNMPLITNYTKLLKIEVSYDLELSVYMELILAVFGVWFFSIWDKGTDENDAEDIVLPQFRGFFKKISVMATIVFAVVVAAVIRGKTVIFPSVFDKLIVLFRQGLETQTGILETTTALYGILGLFLMGYFIYSVLDRLRKGKLLRTSRHRKLFRIMAWTFVIQALFLTQSMASMPIYIIFVVVMLNECNEINQMAETLTQYDIMEDTTKLLNQQDKMNDTEELLEKPSEIDEDTEFKGIDNRAKKADECNIIDDEAQVLIEYNVTDDRAESFNESDVVDDEIKSLSEYNVIDSKAESFNESNVIDNDTADQKKGEDADEADYSNPMLQ